MLNEKNLSLAGWLAVLSTVLPLPLLAVNVVSWMAEDHRALWHWLAALAGAVYVGVEVYLIVMFRHLLNQKAAFHDVDRYITWLIGLSIAISALGILDIPLAEAEDVMDIVSLILTMVYGIVCVVFGIKLLNCEDNLFGYLKPFAYLHIATGVMTAMILFILLAIATSIISDVILALIFFKGAKLAQTQGLLPGAAD
jgi:hypothetical protein